MYVCLCYFFFYYYFDLLVLSILVFEPQANPTLCEKGFGLVYYILTCLFCSCSAFPTLFSLGGS